MHFAPGEKFPAELLVFDLDGTLLDSRGVIPVRSQNVLAECRRRGIMIGVATARSEATCRKFTALIRPELLISCSGSMVRLNGGVIYECCFTEEETSALIGQGMAAGRGITVDCRDATYSNRRIDFFHEPGMKYTDFAGFREPSFKICIEGTDTDFAARTAALAGNCSWQGFCDCDWFKFTRGSVSKGDALVRAAAAAGIPPERIAAFGDDVMDIEMLEVCGVGVAMGNAPEEVARRADMVIGDNDSGAIAEWIENYIL